MKLKERYEQAMCALRVVGHGDAVNPEKYASEIYKALEAKEMETAELVAENVSLAGFSAIPGLLEKLQGDIWPEKDVRGKMVFTYQRPIDEEEAPLESVIVQSGPGYGFVSFDRSLVDKAIEWRVKENK